VIIGNKSDLTYNREVRKDEAQAYALANNFLWMETSAKEMDNVQLAFDVFIGQVYHEVVEPQQGEAKKRLSSPEGSAQTLGRRASFVALAGGMGNFMGRVGGLVGNALDFVEKVIEEEIEGDEEATAPVKPVPSFVFEDTGSIRQGRRSFEEEEERESKTGGLSVRHSMPLKRAASMDFK
jgi:hypothetical protein